MNGLPHYDFRPICVEKITPPPVKTDRTIPASAEKNRRATPCIFLKLALEKVPNRETKKATAAGTTPRPTRKVPPKALPKGPPDRFLELYLYWDLWVPFRKDFTAFTQETAKAMGRHVSGGDKTMVNSLLRGEQKNLKSVHDRFLSRAPESNFVIVRATLRFKKNDHTDFDWLNIEAAPPLSLKDSIK